jgi:hypothetical protein
MKAYLESEEVAKLEKAAFNLRDKLLIMCNFSLSYNLDLYLAVSSTIQPTPLKPAQASLLWPLSRLE